MKTAALAKPWRRRRGGGTTTLVWIAVVAIACPVDLPAQQNLLAPVYPGAVRASEYETGFDQVYLSKDPPETVVDWYRQVLGIEPVYEPPKTGRHWWFGILSLDEVTRILDAAGRRSYAITDAGVDVRHHPYSAPGVQFEPCRSDHFAALRDLVALGRRTRDDLDALCRRYGWIETAFFRLHDPEGLRQPVDRYLLAQTRDQWVGPEGAHGREAAELRRRIEALIEAGDVVEAAKVMRAADALADRDDPNRSAEVWSAWVTHLQNVADAAYRSMVIIHKHPLHWRRRDESAVHDNL